jgi:hypothetical protein
LTAQNVLVYIGMASRFVWKWGGLVNEQYFFAEEKHDLCCWTSLTYCENKPEWKMGGVKDEKEGN